MTYPRSTPLDSAPQPFPSQTQKIPPTASQKTPAKKAAKKAPVKRAPKVSPSTYIVTLPLTKKDADSLLSRELVIFKDQPKTLQVKNLVQGDNKQLKEIMPKSVPESLREKRLARDVDIKRCRAYYW